MSPDIINLLPAQAEKVTVGLASHWPCVTDNSGISTYGLTALGREMSTPPTLERSMAHFNFLQRFCGTWPHKYKHKPELNSSWDKECRDGGSYHLLTEIVCLEMYFALVDRCSLWVTHNAGVVNQYVEVTVFCVSQTHHKLTAALESTQ